MAGAGYKDFTAGDVLTAAQVDTYLMEQSTMVFATASARDTALSAVKAEGMMAYLADAPNRLTYYDGSAWQTVWSDWVSFTPSWTNLTVGSGTNTGEYCYAPGGMWVRGTFVYGSGSTMASGPSLTLPNSESLRAATPGAIYGNAGIAVSGGSTYQIVIRYSSLTAVGFSAYRADATNAYFATVTNTTPITAGWATNDALQYQFFAPLA